MYLIRPTSVRRWDSCKNNSVWLNIVLYAEDLYILYYITVLNYIIYFYLVFYRRFPKMFNVEQTHTILHKYWSYLWLKTITRRQLQFRSTATRSRIGRYMVRIDFYEVRIFSLFFFFFIFYAVCVMTFSKY